LAQVLPAKFAQRFFTLIRLSHRTLPDQGLTMVSALVGIATVTLFWQTLGSNVDKPGEPVKPEVVIPGEWLMDKAQHFLFLPLSVPADVPIAQCKVMSNGDSLLVVVTEKPQEEPDTNALKKYKLVIEAIKSETNHDESLLQEKLKSWIETEDDDEVKVHIQAAMDSLVKVQQGKSAAAHKTISVPLGAAKSKNAVGAQKHTAAKSASFLQNKQVHHHHTARVIKESFAVEIPYPIGSERIALVRTNPTTLMVAMPLERKSMAAKGISTGGKAFNRVPTFNNVGQWLAGPKMDLSKVVVGLSLDMAVNRVGLSPLSDD